MEDLLKQTGDDDFRIAAADGDAEELQKLIYTISSIDAQDPETGKTALHYAVQSKKLAVLVYLLDRGASPTVADNEGNTPLHDAAKDLQLMFMISMLVKHLPIKENGEVVPTSPNEFPELREDVDASIENNNGESAFKIVVTNYLDKRDSIRPEFKALFNQLYRMLSRNVVAAQIKSGKLDKEKRGYVVIGTYGDVHVFDTAEEAERYQIKQGKDRVYF